MNVINGLIDGYFDFLEEKGLMNIGDYVVFRDMFEYVDKRVFEVIDKVFVNMKKVI